MKISKFLTVGALALAFVFAPVATNAQTTIDGLAAYPIVFQQLGAFLNGISTQLVNLVKTNPQDPTINKYLEILPALSQQQNLLVNQFVIGIKNAQGQATLPSITISSPSYAEEVKEGSNYNINFSITNRPTDPTNWRFAIYLQPGDVLKTKTILDTHIGDIPEGNPRTYAWTPYNINENTQDKTHYLQLCLYNTASREKSCNEVKFQIISSGTITNRPPSISGVSGPITLSAGQSGTWSVTATDPDPPAGGSSLSYSVAWGDEATAGTSGAVQQTATFSHTYSSVGTYYPTFTVTDNSGQSARTSLSVVVGGGSGNNGLPRITSGTLPTGATIGQPVRLEWNATDPDGDNLSWGVDFGDGTATASACPSNLPNNNFSVTHSWSKSGNYTVRANVYDCRGGSAVSSAIIPITDASVSIPTITSSYPPNGAVDARDTSGTSSDFRNVTLVLSEMLDNLNSSDFSVSSTNSASALSASVYLAPDRQGMRTNQAVASLSRNLLPGERIRINHLPSKSSICLGFLPGDVDGNGWFLNADLGRLNALVGTAEGAAQPLYKTDINRDGVFNQADVTKAGEILSTPGTARSLPACPAPLSAAPSEAQIASAISAINSILQSLRQVLSR
ncbi:MAG: PKD domain-containing protein [Patescibacteria group bacterium]